MYLPSEQCLALLRKYNDHTPDGELRTRLKTAATALIPYLPATIEQHQMDALVSLYDDVLTQKVHSHEKNFLKSSLLEDVVKGHHTLAASEFMKWSYKNGKLNNKAYNRRVEESNMYRTQVQSIAGEVAC